MTSKLDMSFFNPTSVLRSLFAGILLAILYSSALKWLITKDWPREDYSYAYIIPIVVLYMFWEKRKEFISLPSERSWSGLLMIIPGIILFWIGELSGELYSVYVSSWLLICGCLWMTIGRRKLKTIAFPIVIMLAAFPLPHFINTKLTFQLKMLSSWLGVKLLQLYGISAYREGNIIDLGFTQLQVVDACSGLRYLLPLIIMGLIVSYYYRAKLWKKTVIVLSTVPLSIITNSIRIALTGILYQSWGSKVAEDFFHGFSGWIIFIASLGILLVEIWVLEKVLPEQHVKSPKNSPEMPIVSSNTNRIDFKSLLKPPQYVTAVLVLVVTILLVNLVDFREKIPVKKALSNFPVTIGLWAGSQQKMEQKFIAELDLSDYVIVDYKNGSGQGLNFYLAYYESQRKGESIHSPETCLPGSGWEFQQAGKVLIDGSRGKFQVNRALMVKSGQKELVYFWFPMRGRNLTNAYEMKIYTFWDALTKHRTDGALVRIVTPIYSNENLEKAESRLQSFTREIVPVLDEYLPGK